MPEAFGSFDLISTDGVRRLHEASLSILEETGVKILEQNALKLLGDNGAEVNHQNNIAKLPSDLVKKSLKKCPSTYRMYGRDGKRYCELGDGKLHTRSNLGRRYVVDAFAGERRPATWKDLEDGIKLIEGLKNVEMTSAPVTPQDIEPAMRDIYQWYAVFKNSVKPISGPYTYSSLSARFIFKMAETVCGGEKELQERPVVRYFQCESVTPLVYNRTAMEILFEYAKRNLPVVFAPMGMAGGTAPATLAGAVALLNAEILAGITVGQLLCPGLRVSYGSNSSILDMKTAAFANGAPEMGLLAMLLGSLSRYYELPFFAISNVSDALRPDSQASVEKTLSALSAMLAGAEVGGVGYIGNEAFSYEQAVIDDEILGAVFRIAEGVEISEETLALEVIKSVGPGGNYLKHKHTRDHFRREQWNPEIFNRKRWETWEREGKKTILQRAKERSDQLIASHKVEPLPSEVDRELKIIISAAENQLVKQKK